MSGSRTNGDGLQRCLVWNNLPVMLVWGAITLVLFLLVLQLECWADYRVSGDWSRHLARLSGNPLPGSA